jgi:hypothetical protein
MNRKGYFAAAGGGVFVPSWRFLGHGRRNGNSFSSAPNPNRMVVCTLASRRANSTNDFSINGVTATVIQEAHSLYSNAVVAYAHVPDGDTLTLENTTTPEYWVGMYEIITARREPQSSISRTGTSFPLTNGLSGGEVNGVNIVAMASNNGGNSITVNSAVQNYFADMNGGSTNIGVECRAQGHHNEGTSPMSCGANGSNYMAGVRTTWFED